MGEQQASGGRSLHVFGALERGGAETWLLQALARRSGGWQADLCLLAGREGPCARQAREVGLRLLHCPYRPAATFPARFYNLLRRGRYDAVHSHVLLFGGVVTAVAARAGIPLRVAHAHNSADGRPDSPARRLYRAAMRRAIAANANLVLACSPEAARTFDCPAAQILPYGVDLRPFERPARPMKASLGIPAGAPVLGAVGRLAPQKNYPFLLDALAASPDPSLRLAIAGEGPLRSELERAIAERGLGGRAVLLGLCDDVPDLLLGLCDAFAMPSLHEGLPVALLEAQAAGLPCLVSDTVSPHAIVCDGVERLPLTVQAWAPKLTEAVRRPRLDPAEAASKLRAAGMDAAGAWERLTALYDAALARGQRVRAA